MSNPAKPTRDRALIALLVIAGVKLLLHVFTSGQYAFHRDELATLDDARPRIQSFG